MKYRMEVTFELCDDFMHDPEAHAEIKRFTKDALECWGGQFHPDDWLFDSLENVKVQKITRSRK